MSTPIKTDLHTAEAEESKRKTALEKKIPDPSSPAELTKLIEKAKASQKKDNNEDEITK